MTVHNRKAKTVRCLHSLQDTWLPYREQFGVEVFLTDDGCTDGTADAVSRLTLDFPVRILPGDGSLFWNGGSNTWAENDGNLLWLRESDVTTKDDFYGGDSVVFEANTEKQTVTLSSGLEADGMAVEAKRLSHEDVTGVGYGICSFYPEGKDESRHFLNGYLERKEQELTEAAAHADPYVRLARQSLESYVRDKKRIRVPEDLPEEMLHTRAGAFVSIHKHGKLRGCIGTIEATAENVAVEIIRNAISAATRDPRFDPITPDELKWLEINVDVLGKAVDQIKALGQTGAALKGQMFLPWRIME